MPDMWVEPEEDPRGQEFTHGERETLLDYLDGYRKTLVMKCDGLTPEQLATASVPPSNRRPVRPVSRPSLRPSRRTDGSSCVISA